MVTRLAIIGLGLIGGSIALRSVQRGYQVAGYRLDGLEREQALAAGIMVCDSVSDAVNDADLVVLAVPLPAMGEVTHQVANAIQPSATVIDVGSVKAPVRGAIKAAGLASKYVGTHPMAGNEKSGFVAANPTLLVGASWAMTRDDTQSVALESTELASPLATALRVPGKPLSDWRYQLVYQYLSGTFDARIIELTDAEHDQAQALISGLPHVLAVQLLNQVANSPIRDTALALAAGSFRDGTRVAHTDPCRTQALVTQNAGLIAPALRDAAQALNKLAVQLEKGQDPAAFFHAADALRVNPKTRRLFD